MSRQPTSRARKHSPRVALAALALTGLSACEAPNTDLTRSRGGVAPDPTGLLEGSVLYVGPRPQCIQDATGRAAEVPGHVVLLLFRYDNPPPPSGSATSAENILALPGSTLFALSDCMPAEPTAEDLTPISRTVAFTWPSIRLGRTYQLRGFYDGDADFNPLFSVRSLATRGDIGGGAFVSASASSPQYEPLSFPAAELAPNGFVLGGVSVTLGAPVRTERPLFRVSETTRALSSEATIPLLSDAVAREEALYQLAQMRISLIDGPETTDERGHAYGEALNAAGISFDFRSASHGMPIQRIDANADGVPDAHPILGASVPWYMPAIIMRRAKSPAETRVGLPDVLLIGSIRPTVPLGVRQGFVERATLHAADVVVPPVAILVTNPAFPAVCRVPLIAPGNIAELYEGRPTDCQELPTGNYDVNVLAGAAGGRVVDVFQACVEACTALGTLAEDCTPGCQTEAALRTDTGYVYEGASYSSQSWSIPNELGCPDTAYRPSAVNQLDAPNRDGSLPSCEASQLLLGDQGRRGAFAIVDLDGANAPDPTSTADGHGIASCQTALRTTGPMAGMPSPVTYTAPSAECCAPVLPFCGLPLCPLRDATTTGYPEAVRAHERITQTRELRIEGEDYRVLANGAIEPLCTPFLMPAACCQMR